MRYAINPDDLFESRIEATPKAKGLCIGCKAEMIARCGSQRIHHWAHKNKSEQCDHWWENETEWHRNWKASFPIGWQEIRHEDTRTNEIHIADVKTPNGVVIEFQHSSLKEIEKSAREAFYKNLHWVVDGTRLPNDFKRFIYCEPDWVSLPLFHKFKFPFPDELLPKAWIARPVPVIFDWGFGNELLWLDPRQGHYSTQLGFKLNREAFVAFIQSSHLKPLNR